jgi:hypothetical protein
MLCAVCGHEMVMGYGMAGGGIGPYLLRTLRYRRSFKTRRWKR